MWDGATQRNCEEKHAFNVKCNYKPNEYLFATNIEENNKMFLEELGSETIKGYEELDLWLRGLIVDYVKRCSWENGDTGYFLRYYTDWIDNTLCIIQGKNYNSVEKWCDEYRKYITEYKRKAGES
jgi:hypothetical protein